MDSETTFVAPEGVYLNQPLDDLKPAPSVVPIPANAPIHVTKLSTITIKFPPLKQSGQGFAQLLGVGSKEKARDDDSSSSGTTGRTADNSGSPEITPGDVTAANEPASLFSATSTRKKANSKPKHNIRTTSSTFISRVVVLEGLTKILQGKSGDVTFIFFNSGKSFVWVESGQRYKEPLTRVAFSAFPTCHDVNILTATPDRLDVIIGFNTGDIIWFDAVCSRYARLNKQGCITSSPCTSIRWVPHSTNLFLVSHADGTCILYDKDRDDGSFSVDDPPANGWDQLDSIVVTTQKESKTPKNPMSHWRVSRKKIVDFAFSPDIKYVATISEDGCLRIIDVFMEQLVDCYASYFGGLTCLQWSPDGRYILTGGQDDLLTITSPWEQRVVARCQGHSSFVASVAWDELRCSGRRYRFGSVGQDNKLILWDFASGSLPRPKLQSSFNQRQSMASSMSLALRRGSLLNLPTDSVDSSSHAFPQRFHPAPPRNDVAFLQPVLIKTLESAEILSDFAFLPKVILTATKVGLVKLWTRPAVISKTSGLSKKTVPNPRLANALEFNDREM